MFTLQWNALRRGAGWVFLFAAALPGLAPAAHAQNSSNSRSDAALSADLSGFADVGAMDGTRIRMLRTMALQRNQLRQKAILDDTAQLLRLAQQLKAAVDNGDKDQLSLKNVNTAARIEKLAKTVEKKMRDPN